MKVNNNIRASKVLLIDENGKNYGEIDIYEALNLAQNSGLDLVEINSKNEIPVCKIMDYGKWKYEQEKRKKKNVQQRQQIKEIKFRPNTNNNDLKYRAKQTDKFLKSGNKVKLIVRFKGREQEHIYSTAKSVLERFLNYLTQNYVIYDTAKMEDKSISLLLNPE